MSDGTIPTPTEPRDAEVRTGIVPSVSASHDVSLTTSVAGVVNAQGDASLNQSGACAVVSQGNVGVSQAGAGIVIAQSFAGESFGGGVVVSNDVRVSKGWVGVALSPKLEVADDSRVIIGPAAAAIIALAMFGIFGVVVAGGVYAARRAAQWRPKLPMPSVSWRRLGE